jgi:hypothetical protein
MGQVMAVENDEQKRINANIVLLVASLPNVEPAAPAPTAAANHAHYFCYIAEKIME